MNSKDFQRYRAYEEGEWVSYQEITKGADGQFIKGEVVPITIVGYDLSSSAKGIGSCQLHGAYKFTYDSDSTKQVHVGSAKNMHRFILPWRLLSPLKDLNLYMLCR